MRILSGLNFRGFPAAPAQPCRLRSPLLIGFRINQAYDRWWEARKLWGTLVNVSRNLAVKICALHQPDVTDRESIRNLIVAFCIGLKDHLRDEAGAQADCRALQMMMQAPATCRVLS